MSGHLFKTLQQQKDHKFLQYVFLNLCFRQLPVPVFLPQKPDGSEPAVTAVEEKIRTRSIEDESRSEADYTHERDDRVMKEDKSLQTQSAIGRKCFYRKSVWCFLPESLQTLGES